MREERSISKLVRQGLHYPSVDGIPIYKRVDDTIDTDTNAEVTSRVTEISKEKWGSPDNIRRVFITNSRVIVHLYCPIHNSSTKRRVMEYKFDKPISVQEVASGLIKGNALREIFKPWVFSNIEEVYFDWAVVGSTTVRNLGLGDLYKRYTMPKNYREDAILDKLMEYSTSNKPDWLASYPRLKVVACIRELDKVIDITKANSRIAYDCVGQDRIGIVKEVWVTSKKAIEAIKEVRTPIALKIYNRPKLNTAYSLKDGIYLYDKDTLCLYFKGIELMAREEKLANTMFVPSSSNVDTNREIKDIIDKMISEIGEEATRNMLGYAVKGLSREDIDTQIGEQLTSEERDKFNI